MLALLVSCTPPGASAPILFAVSATDEALLAKRGDADAVLREAAKGLLSPVPVEVARRALEAEGGARSRESILVQARVLVQRAEERFRELDDAEALDLIAKATANLASVHQEAGAIELLARAHLLAGAIYLARERVPAARSRLQRALDLDPNLSPPRDRYAPRVLTELAAIASAQNVRGIGRLEVVVLTKNVRGEVFIDGRLAGATPLTLDAIGEGRHLIRVAAPGYESYVGSFSIAAGREHVERVNLGVDREIAEIAALPDALRLRKDPSPTLALLARRADADRTILAVISLSSARRIDGAPGIGVSIVIPGAGTAHAPAAEVAPVRAALERALRCDATGPAPDALAPYLWASGGVDLHPRPVPDGDPVWTRPWFWATFAVATLAIAGGFVVARTLGGPPEEVTVTLIPRP